MDGLSHFWVIACFSNSESCHLAKQRKLPFHISNGKSLHAFDLIHIDIWGPISIPSTASHRYFLLVVEDKVDLPDFFFFL